MNMIALWLRVTAKRKMATAERAGKLLHQPKVSALPPAKLTTRHAVSVRNVDGFDCWTVAPRQEAKRAAVYLHGGAYISGMSPQHWALIGALADAGVAVEVPLYGLAPEHTFQTAYPLVATVYAKLLERFEPSRVSIVGDSAGGGLALGFAQTLLESDRAQPGRIVLIAPWLDLSLSNPDTTAAEQNDPWLSSAGLREAGRSWAGGADVNDPRLSPLRGRLAGLAPLSVWVGTRDLFHPDVVQLKRLAEAAGVTCDLNIGEGAIHVYPLVPAPEGRRASAQVVDVVAG